MRRIALGTVAGLDQHLKHEGPVYLRRHGTAPGWLCDFVRPAPWQKVLAYEFRYPGHINAKESWALPTLVKIFSKEHLAPVFLAVWIRLSLSELTLRVVRPLIPLIESFRFPSLCLRWQSIHWWSADPNQDPSC